MQESFFFLIWITLNATGQNPWPGDGKEIVVQLHVFHQWDIILKHTLKKLLEPKCLHTVRHCAFLIKLIIAPWFYNSHHRKSPRCHSGRFSLSCGRTHPRCSFLFHLYPMLPLFGMLNSQHPKRILKMYAYTLLFYKKCYTVY